MEAKRDVSSSDGCHTASRVWWRWCVAGCADNTKTVYPARARNVVSIYKAICHGFKFSGWASLAECAGVEVLYLWRKSYKWRSWQCLSTAATPAATNSSKLPSLSLILSASFRWVIFEFCFNFSLFPRLFCQLFCRCLIFLLVNLLFPCDYNSSRKLKEWQLSFVVPLYTLGVVIRFGSHCVTAAFCIIREKKEKKLSLRNAVLICVPRPTGEHSFTRNGPGLSVMLAANTTRKSLFTRHRPKKIWEPSTLAARTAAATVTV